VGTEAKRTLSCRGGAEAKQSRVGAEAFLRPATLSEAKGSVCQCLLVVFRKMYWEIRNQPYFCSCTSPIPTIFAEVRNFL